MTRHLPSIARSAFLRLAVAGALLLAALSILAATPATADAESPTSLGRTGWESARPYSPVQTAYFPQHGAIGFYDYIPSPGVPAADAASWSDCGPGNPLCPSSETIGMTQFSRLGGVYGCLSSADFTFFQSFVSIPAGTTISQFSVNMSGADDGARVAIYNSAYPSGFVFPGSYIYLGGAQSTTDLSAAMVPGEVNRVVITQMDDCATGNNLQYAAISLNGTVLPQQCEPGYYSATGNAPCEPAPPGSYVSIAGATEATLCPAGTYASAPASVQCAPVPPGSFAPTAGTWMPSLCAPGTFSDTAGAVECQLAPPGTFVATPGQTSAIECPAGLYSSTAGSVECTLAPAGSYVPVAGSTSPIACPTGYWSEVGAVECYPIDTDGDGVPDIEDAFPNSDLGPVVIVGACNSGVANQLLGNGATMNDLIAAAIAGARNHGAAVSAVAALSNGWKAEGLISGRQHGAIVSCIARSDAGKRNR